MSIAKYRSEASYAHSHRKGGGCSTKQVKLLRKATKDYHRAVRRNKRNIIATEIAAEQPSHYPYVGRTYHEWGHDWSEDDYGVWSMEEGSYCLVRHDIDYDRIDLLCQQFQQGSSF